MIIIVKKYFLETKKERGFSLIEILTTVAILALLAGIAVPTYIKRTRLANRQECLSSLSSLRNAQQFFASTHGHTFNFARCPKTWGLHSRLDGTPSQEIPEFTIPEELSIMYCKKQESSVSTMLRPPYPFYIDVESGAKSTFIYNYRIRGVSVNADYTEWDVDHIFDGWVFPYSFTSWNNFLNRIGKINPGQFLIFPTDAEMIAAGLRPPNLLKSKAVIEFLLMCNGNLDDNETTPDAIIMDDLGNTFLYADDTFVY